MDEVRRHFTVHRLAGDEGLLETLAREAEADADVISRWARRTVTEAGTPLASLTSLVGTALRTLGDWTLKDYRELHASARQREEAVAAAEERTGVARERLRILEDLRRLHYQLTELRARAPDLNERLAKIDKRIEQVKEERDRVNRDLETIAAKAAVAKPARQELVNARTTLERNRGNLEIATTNATVLAIPLGISVEPEAAARLEASVMQSIAQLVREQSQLDAAPAMRELLDVITTRLLEGEQHGLAQEIAVDDIETGIQLTVAQTHGGMSARRAFLEGQPPPPRAKEVAANLVRARATLYKISQLKVALEEMRRWSRLVIANEERVEKAVATVMVGGSQQARESETQRRQLDDELLELASARAALRQQLGADDPSLSEDALSAQIATAEASIDAPPEDIDSAIVQATSDLNEAEVGLANDRTGLSESRHQVARMESDVRRSVTALIHDPSLNWVRAGVDGVLPAEGTLIEQQLAGLDVVRTRVNLVAERLGRHPAQLGAVEFALRDISRHLTGQSVRFTEYVTELKAWLGGRFSEWFQNDRVRRELFPQATSSIRVDVERRQVSWEEGKFRRTRPLEAFSSGEQAFAYTRARLALLDSEPARSDSRLIVLDEFGAFIAHDRLAGLLEYLRGRASAEPNDQLLVVLPLARDYELLTKQSVSPEQEQFAEMAAQVRAQQFAVRVIVP